MDKYAFGNKLCELREEFGYTQSKLGEMLGVSNKAISKWENGTTQPRLQMLDKIAECFNMTVEELLEYNSEAKTDITHKKYGNETSKMIVEAPNFSISFFMGLGRVSFDEQDLIKKIKCEYGFSNKEIGKILDISEKKIGIWENGLKHSSSKDSIKLANLYYSNSNESEKAKTIVESIFGCKQGDIMIKLATCLFTTFIIIFYPLFLIMDELQYAEINKEFITKTNYSLLFTFVFPLAIVLPVPYMFYKYIRLKGTKAFAVKRNFRLFLILFYFYMLVVSLYFDVSKTLIFIILLYDISFVIFLLLFSKSFSRAKDIFGCFIFGIFLFEFAFWTIKSVKNVDFVNVTNLAISFTMLISVSCAILEYVSSSLFNYYNYVKQHFPPFEEQDISVKIKDIVKVCLVIAFFVAYFFLIDYNKITIIKVLGEQFLE